MSEKALSSLPEQVYALLYAHDNQLQTLSLDSGKLLASTNSGRQYPIIVRENADYRWAHFQSRAIQTALALDERWNLVMPCNRHMCAWQLFLDTPVNALLLGVGGGALARYLRRYFPAAHICGVEQSAQMIQLSNRYFYLEGAIDRVVQADALEFVFGEHGVGYDLIQIDLFYSNAMPAGLWGAQFYQACAGLLSRTGVLMMNTIVNDAQAFSRLLALLRDSFQRKTLCLPVPGHDNIIILAFAGRPEAALEKLRKRAGLLGQRYRMDFHHILDQLIAVNPKAGGQFILG